MYCYQCEETAKGTGCTVAGVCGKSPEVAALQDLLTHVTKGIAKYAHRTRRFGHPDAEVDAFVLEALFTTVTNVNFDEGRLGAMLYRAGEIKNRAKRLYEQACKEAGQPLEPINGAADWQAPPILQEMIEQGRQVGVYRRVEALGADAAGLQELLTYGLKGTAAYAWHARILGHEDEQVYAFFHEALDFLTRENVTADELVAMNLRCGEVNLRVMELLDQANTGAYGHPEPTRVRVTPVRGKAILISGHDLKDLEALLKQTEGTGINVYTHSEMLPAHAYPELKKYAHLVGNYGGAWHEQQREFDDFPGAIIMTTNCIQKPRPSYQGRLFTVGPVAWPDTVHIQDRDFTPAIAAARAGEGFAEDGAEEYITVGFGHQAVLSVADKVVEAVKGGAIRHFFLIGGCDAHKSSRSYYTELAQQVPDDCVVLTLACGKYRFNRLTFGEIGGIPRLLDMGQCNDAYSAIRVAGALAQAFDCDVNDLPLSLVLSWYEQKAVCILLTLLSLGIKRIRIGPSLPAFISPAVLDVLVEKFELMPITSPEEDLRAILGSQSASTAEGS